MHRRKRISRRQIKKQRKIVVISLIAFLFIMVGGYAAFQTNLNITAKGNIVDRSKVIQSWASTSNEDFHTDYYKENIVSVTFLDDARVPSNAVESWDVSESKDKGVMAYVIPNSEDSTKYDLYIGANGGVIANEDSSYLFYSMFNIKTVDFNNNFDTSNTIKMNYMFGTEYEKVMNIQSINFGDKFKTHNVTDMSYMFFNNSFLTDLDVSGFDTSSVQTFARTFHGCESLTYLDVSNFDMSNVITILDMFNGCRRLTNLDVSKWDTSNIRNFSYSFGNFNSMEVLNLCSFDTSNATSMGGMFSWSNSLKNIYVGPNWSTAGANTTDMFLGSSVSEVTTGQC